MENVVGLTPTFESEMLTENDEYIITFYSFNNTLTITDVDPSNGVLNQFDLITVIVNYSYGLISSYSEIELLDEFNQILFSSKVIEI